MRWLLAFAVALFVSANANAQTAVQQTGPVSENGAVMWSTDHKIRQAAGALGDVAGKMITGGFSAVGNVCAFSDTTNNAYAALCLNPNGSLTFNGSAYPLTGGGGNVSGPTPTTIGELVSWNSEAGVLLRQGAASLTDNKTGGVIADGAALTSSSNNTYTANQIYQMTTTVPVSTYDAVRGIAVSTPGSTTTGVTGLAGYVVGNTALGSGGNSASPVALFGTGVANANGAFVWGINTLLTDTAVPGVVSSGLGRELWNELDFQVTSPNTTVRGLVLTGASIAQPALSLAVEVRPLGANSHWSVAFGSQAGAATNGLVLGTQGVTGTVSSPSQQIVLGWSASDSTVYGHTLQSTASGLTLDSTAISGTGNFILNKGGFRTVDAGSVAGMVLGQQNATGVLSDSQSLHFSYSNAVGVAFNNVLKTTSDGVLNIVTSGGPTNGSFNIPAGARYMVNGVAGANCTGVPTASHATVGGITTVC